MAISQEYIRRIVSERERLGLTAAQFAVLIGIPKITQERLEAGELDVVPFQYPNGLVQVGVDPLFVLGQSDTPRASSQQLLFGDDAFLKAVDLLRKSQDAVDAFVGQGASQTSPELVAALMNATLQERYCLGAGTWEEFADKIANAIEGVGSQIAEAMKLVEE